MNIYSQNGEDLIVAKFFNGYTGTLLSLGENDGRTLSNCLSFIEDGWIGCVVEPSPTAFKKLQELHEGNDLIYCRNVAVGAKAGKLPFWDSGEHLGIGDSSLLSTLKESELDRWKGSNNTFHNTEVEVVTFKMLLDSIPIKKFDLISIDIEGVELDILPDMDFKEMETKCVIIEWNSNMNVFNQYVKIFDSFCFKLLHQNGENLIFINND